MISKMTQRKYQLPDFLTDSHSQGDYEKWLQRKSQSHLKRDRKRGNITATGKEYKEAIHQAVCDCNGLDVYTGEWLDWSLMSKWDNDKAQEGGREYKQEFALLPSVDHVSDGTGQADFKICSWRTNDAKNDLSLDEFKELCKKVLEKK
ncbi:Protein export cytoplasm protein SecA ATPase RNA helicase (TC 3.A.5.1.1) [uncultured Candidatus Thioglobus sp.]|nr:Protein export cytoplasm protein SecA ATPase RNA helicase (TC 3.A.5.1.1) [uncultured Candidatus Thioglobus sp.]